MSGPATLTMSAPELASRGCERLGRRERQVLALVARGLLNKQIGGELGISEGTVKVHLLSISKKHGNVAHYGRHRLALWYLASCPPGERDDILRAALPAPLPAPH